jgi:hypothetical protein
VGKNRRHSFAPKKTKNVVGEKFPPGEQQATPLDSGAEHQTKLEVEK